MLEATQYQKAKVDCLENLSRVYKRLAAGATQAALDRTTKQI